MLKRAYCFLKISKLSLCLFLLSCDPSTLYQQSPFSFVQTLHVGVYEYNAHSLGLETLFDCQTEPFCKNVQIDTPQQTRAVLSSIGWDQEVLTSFLQTESFKTYQKKHAYHILIFIFQSQGNSYVRIVNYLSETLETYPVSNGSNLSLALLLQGQELLFVHSEPTLADVYINEVMLSEAPLWIQSPDQTMDLQCKFPGSSSKVVTFDRGSTLSLECKLY